MGGDLLVNDCLMQISGDAEDGDETLASGHRGDDQGGRQQQWES